MKSDKAVKSPLLFTLKGALICAISFAVSVAAVSIACYFSPDPISYYGLCGFLSVLISAVISAFINAKRSRGKSPILPVCSALMFVFAMLAVSLIISGGNCGSALIGALICYSMISALICTLLRKNARKIKPRRHYR